jgi:predicted transcriptional regulator
VLSIPIKDPDTNQINTQEKKVEGPVAFIETTTKTHLHDENETRCFEIFIDDSVDQTRRIHEVQRLKYKTSGGPSGIDLRVWRTAQSLLVSLPVYIPFVECIKFPDQPLRVRRDFERFLTLMSVSAVLHQFQRDRVPFGETEAIVATIADYAVAYELASVVLESSLRQLTKKGDQLIQQIKELTESKSNTEFTLQEITAHVGWNRKTVVKYLRELAQLGLVDIPDFRRGAALLCKFLRCPDRYDNQLMSPEELERPIEIDGSRNLTKPVQKQFGQDNSIINSELCPLVQSARWETEGKNE